MTFSNTSKVTIDCLHLVMLPCGWGGGWGGGGAQLKVHDIVKSIIFTFSFYLINRWSLFLYVESKNELFNSGVL